MLPTKQLVAPLTIKCLARFPGDADLRPPTLRAITQPALVVSGSHDTMVPADNAYAMFKAQSDAQLNPLSRLRPRRAVSVPGVVRQPRPNLPERVTELAPHEFGEESNQPA